MSAPIETSASQTIRCAPLPAMSLLVSGERSTVGYKPPTAFAGRANWLVRSCQNLLALQCRAYLLCHSIILSYDEFCCLLELLGRLLGLSYGLIGRAEVELYERDLWKLTRGFFEHLERRHIVTSKVVDPTERILELRDLRLC